MFVVDVCVTFCLSSCYARAISMNTVVVVSGYSALRRASESNGLVRSASVRSCIRACVRSFVRSFARSFVHSYVLAFVRSFVHSFVRSFFLLFSCFFHVDFASLFCVEFLLRLFCDVSVC